MASIWVILQEKFILDYETASSGSYLWVTIMVLVLNLSTVGYSCGIFSKSRFMCNRTTYVALLVFRIMLAIAVVVVMFTTAGKELSFGIWVITSVCFFVCLEIY